MEKIQELYETKLQEAIDAANTLYNYCKSFSDCEKCPFYRGSCAYGFLLPQEWDRFIDPKAIIRHKYTEVWDTYVTSALKIGEIIEDVINIMEKNK